MHIPLRFPRDFFVALLVLCCLDLPAADGATPPILPAPVGDPAKPAGAGIEAKVDMKRADDLRAQAQTAIAGLLKSGGSHPIELMIQGQAQSVDLVGVDDKKNILYKQFGKKSTLEFKDLRFGQVAAILQALTDPALPAAATNQMLAGLLYALEGNAMASSSALTQAFELNPDLSDTAQEQLKALQPLIQALHPAPAAVTLPAAGNGATGTAPGLNQPGLPAPPSPSLAKTGYECLGLSGGGSFFCPSISPADPKMMMVYSDMSCAFLTYDGGVSWCMLHRRHFTGYTHCKAGFHPTDPNTIYAANGYSGALSVTHDRGETWEPHGKLTGLQGEIAIDPANPNRMLTGAGNAVHITSDGGLTWDKCDGPAGKPLAFHFGLPAAGGAATRALFAATEDGLWRSDDGGKTWAAKDAGLPGRPLQAFCGGSNLKTKVSVLYASVPSKNEGGKFAGGVYRSTDGGERWEWAMGTGINLDTQKYGDYGNGPISRYYAVMTCDANPQAVWTLNTSTGYFPPHHEAAFRSDDMGKTWRATYFSDPRFPEYNAVPNWLSVTTGQSWQGGAAFGWAINPKNPDHIVKCDAMFFFITDDGGKTWKNGHTQAPPGVTPTKETGWICNGLTDTSTWNYYIDPLQPGLHYLCYTDIGFARSKDSGKTWLWNHSPDLPGPWHNTTYELAFDPATPGKFWGAFSQVHDIPNGNIINGGHSSVGIGGIGLTTDSAATWKPANQGLPDAPALSVILDPKSPAGNRTLYAAIWEQGVFKSSDDGKSWTKKSSGLGAAANLRVIRVQLAADGSLYALVTAKKNGANFLAEGVGLYQSKNGGDSWSLVPGSNKYLWPKDFTLDPANPGTIYLGCADANEKQGGLYRTTDSGATWTLVTRKGSQHFGVFLHPKNKGWLYMTLAEGPPEAGLYLSRDNGATWTPYLELPFTNAQRVAFDPKDDSVIYVTTFGGSAFKMAATPRGN